MGRTPTPRKARRAAFTGIAALALAAAGFSAAPAQAQPDGAAAPTVHADHPYRHGAVPQRGHESSHAATSTADLNYGGGAGSPNIGVTTGPEHVYLVFWGSQWGSSGTDANGNTTLSGDSQGMAPRLQQLFKGIGTGNELWSGVMTQYCEGIASGSQSCPSNAAHVGYPTGGALAGVWVDTSAAAPASANGNQIGAEAVKASGHFGNTTAAANRNNQYVVVSPSGTTPDGFNTASGNFCAWHDYTGDSTLTGGAVSSPYGQLAFTNLPYVTDAGSSCGQGYVNAGSAGTLDGVTIVEGHEYAETITDQNPAGGWTDSSGAENGDKCAWISSGQGASANVSFTTGSFAMQSTWANDFNGGAGGCEMSHPIVGGTTGNTVTVTNPGAQSGTTGTAVSLQMSATDSASGQTLSYSASGLPAGLSISTSGLISGTPTAAGSSSVTVTATDGTGASGSTTFGWTVSGTGGSGGITNGGFETGTTSGWTTVGNASATTTAKHTGSYGAMLGSTNPSTTSSASQTFTAPTGSSKVSFWYDVTCPDTVTYDWATATLKDNTANTTSTVLAKTCTNGLGWQSASGAVTPGHSYTLTLTNVDDNYPGDPTYTYYDDVTVS
ncbi:putative Ig domain-containing protein [Streptomyces sp. FH025]|uniref:putative Ig domain-containing protein n=1 Tax=Streptomyces sp. FH025 TaxID=2815937 RepID=UPI001FAFECF0|nr:putative Ig domain-containing protein [Streptomyces sp. FH025]